MIALRQPPDQPAAVSLLATFSQYLIGGIMPDSAIVVQQRITVIEIRPFKDGWQCYQGPGVEPCWIGEKAKEDAIGYAKARAKFERGEIRVLVSRAFARAGIGAKAAKHGAWGKINL